MTQTLTRAEALKWCAESTSNVCECINQQDRKYYVRCCEGMTQVRNEYGDVWHDNTWVNLRDFRRVEPEKSYRERFIEFQINQSGYSESYMNETAEQHEFLLEEVDKRIKALLETNNPHEVVNCKATDILLAEIGVQLGRIADLLEAKYGDEKAKA